MDSTNEMNQQAAQEGFAVVLLGSMNPALHHPAWYESIGAISSDEEKDALSREFVFVPQIAQFSTGGFELLCDPQRWQIVTTDASRIPRLVQLASVVFDEKLVETPLTAVGLNFLNHAKTSCPNVAGVFSEMLTRLPLGFRAQPGSSGKVIFSEPLSAARVRWEIEPSLRGEDHVYVAGNFHLDLGVALKPTRFNLKAVIDARLGEFSELQRNRVATVLESLGGKS